MASNTQIFYDAEILAEIETKRQLYVYKETGLTLSTCYSGSDLDFFLTVAAEIVPQELNTFLEMLAAYYPAIDPD